MKIAMVDSFDQFKISQKSNFDVIYSYDYGVPSTKKITDIVNDFKIDSSRVEKLKESRVKLIEETLNLLQSFEEKEMKLPYGSLLANAVGFSLDKDFGRALEKYAVVEQLLNKGHEVIIFEDLFLQKAVATSKLVDSLSSTKLLLNRSILHLSKYFVRSLFDLFTRLFSIILATLFSVFFKKNKARSIFFSHCPQSSSTIKAYWCSRSSIISEPIFEIRYDTIMGRSKLLSSISLKYRLFFLFSVFKLTILQSFNLYSNPSLSIELKSWMLNQLIRVNFGSLLITRIAKYGGFDQVNSAYFGSDDLWSRVYVSMSEFIEGQTETNFISHGILTAEQEDEIRKYYDNFIQGEPGIERPSVSNREQLSMSGSELVVSVALPKYITKIFYDVCKQLADEKIDFKYAFHPSTTILEKLRFLIKCPIRHRNHSSDISLIKDKTWILITYRSKVIEDNIRNIRLAILLDMYQNESLFRDWAYKFNCETVDCSFTDDVLNLVRDRVSSSGAK